VGGGSRRDDKPDGSSGWLGKGRLANQKDRSASEFGATMEAASRRQIEFFGIAAQFQKNSGKSGEARRLLGDPEGVDEFGRFGKEQIFRLEPERLRQSLRIRQARFVKNLGRTNPEQGPLLRCGLQKPCHEPHHKSGREAGITGFSRMDFCQRSFWETATKVLVENLGAGCEKIGFAESRGAAADHGRIGERRRGELIGKPPLNLRNLAAQGRNSLPRHGVVRHGGTLSGMFVPVMFL